MYLLKRISGIGTGALVDCIISVGLLLGQKWTVDKFSRTGTGAVVYCSVSV